MNRNDKIQTGEISSLNLLRALAIIAVVIIHTMPNVLKESMGAGEAYTYSTIHRFMNFAVPVFAMITGALMIEKNESYGKCLKRAGRLLIALFVFGVPMCFLERIVSTGLTLKNFIYSFVDILQGNTWDVMWYLYMIIGLYLFMPVIAGFSKHADDKTILYVLGILFAFNSILVLVSKKWINIDFSIPCKSIYVFYALSGYFLLYRQKIKLNKKWLYMILACIVASIIIIGIVAPNYEIAESYFTYSSPIIVILSLVLFMIFKDFNMEYKYINIISKCSFGIYLTHCFFIHLVEFAFDVYSYETIRFVTVPFMIFSVFIMSLLITCIMKKIPYMNKIL